jgi:hypothetical protein
MSLSSVSLGPCVAQVLCFLTSDCQIPSTSVSNRSTEAFPLHSLPLINRRKLRSCTTKPLRTWQSLARPLFLAPAPRGATQPATAGPALVPWPAGASPSSAEALAVPTGGRLATNCSTTSMTLTAPKRLTSKMLSPLPASSGLRSKACPTRTITTWKPWNKSSCRRPLTCCLHLRCNPRSPSFPRGQPPPRYYSPRSRHKFFLVCCAHQHAASTFFCYAKATSQQFLDDLVSASVVQPQAMFEHWLETQKDESQEIQDEGQDLFNPLDPTSWQE